MLETILNSFKSRTVWLGLIVTVLSWVQGTIMDAGLSGDQVSLVGTVLGALIVWLRSLTTKPLSEK